MTTQPTLPGIPDYSQQVECSGRELSKVISDANVAGYDAVGMTVLHPSGYRVRFQRQPCGCDLCQAIGAPSDTIEPSLRMP